MTHIAEQVATQHNKQVELAYNTFMFEMPPTQRSSGFLFSSPNFVMQPYWQSSTRGDS
jgi:hypothetical protein